MAADPAVNGLGLISTTTLWTRAWPADTEHLGDIRARTRSWLTRLGLRQDGVADVVLAVNEAVSNAIEHAYRDSAGGTVELTFAADAGTVCVDVVDHGHWRAPRPGRSGRGHGLPIMCGVVDSVSVVDHRPGTRVRLRRSRT
ncbi:ATP-binding protein [Pseudonocardia sp. KRD291]|uniref:ATP-binding protein n=1 Tax=Pseudonocardia sp. KRD291 TaxID=2792007 RepID=UPI001C4A3601|nr:ATP-binding protein [Pseudonocardia sp. KRD291]MBW0102720.1 ATP-binding protein [Pseudonocardia sp. KRD291]